MFDSLTVRKCIGTLCLGAAGGLLSAPALAQSALEKPAGQPAAERNRAAAPGTATRTAVQRAGAAATNQGGQQAGNLNNEIAVWLILGNQEEVALAQFAEQRSQNPEVKRFAQQLIEHHQKTLAKIEQATPETADWKLQLRTGEADRSAASPQTGGVQQASAEVEVSTNNAAHHQSVQLAQQIKQECLNLTEQELSQQQGVDFDKAYIGQQVGAHVGMLAQLRGSKNFATGPLQQVISEGEQMTQKHLAEAKQIMSQIKDQHGSSAAQTSRRPTATQ